MITTRAFWRGAFERALKTFAQSLLAVIGVGGLGVLDVDWIGALSVAAVATLASLLTSIGNAEFTAGVPRRATIEPPDAIIEPVDH